MRPARVQQLLLDAAAALPGASAKAFADTGHTRHPYGVALDIGGRTSRWQVALMSAPGETWGTGNDDPAPVLGEKPPTMEIPALTGDLATVEHALIAQLLATDPGEIASVELYSDQTSPPAVGHGATIEWHDGSRTFVNHVR
ncbi:hypothetical protein ACFWA9_04375 [Kitasatospora sp. NPDC059973]|uniref:hypothetical protein n=1 Tax=Kitasatospora sp. NPDC059973 TaxID=3347020 RepID=UPI0036C69F2F